MDLLGEVIEIISKAIEFIKNLPWKYTLTIVSVIMLVLFLIFLWWRTPDPSTIKIEPLHGNIVSNEISLDAKVSKLSLTWSLKSEIFYALASYGKHGNSVRVIRKAGDLLGQDDGPRAKEIIIPRNAGYDSHSGINIYTWEKSYRRYFTKDTPEETLYDYNLILVQGNSVLYLEGKRNDYLTWSFTVYSGTISIF